MENASFTLLLENVLGFYKMIGPLIFHWTKIKQKWKLFQMYTVNTYTSSSIFSVLFYIINKVLQQLPAS